MRTPFSCTPVSLPAPFFSIKAYFDLILIQLFLQETLIAWI